MRANRVVRGDLMIRAPQQTGVHRVAASNGVHVIDKADRLGRFVDDPGVSRGFHLAKITGRNWWRRFMRPLYAMSALPPKADIGTQSRNVRFVPKADMVGATVLVDRWVAAW